MTAGILAGILTLAEALATARAHQPQLAEAGASASVRMPARIPAVIDRKSVV